MSVESGHDQHPTQRFEGKAPPWHFYALFGVPVPALLLVLYAADVSSDPRLLALATLNGGIALISFLASRFRNCVTLEPDHLTISVWILAPGGTVHVPYQKITRVEADDPSGSLAVWFNDTAGDTDAKEIILREPSYASSVKDAILQRRPSSDIEPYETGIPDAAVAPPAVRLPELPGEKLSHKVDTPTWMRLTPVGGLLVGGATVLIADRDFTLDGVLVIGILTFLLTLFFATLQKFQTYFILHPDKVDIREALGDRHSIKYADVVDAEGHDSGWLSVTYAKRKPLGSAVAKAGGNSPEAPFAGSRHCRRDQIEA